MTGADMLGCLTPCSPPHRLLARSAVKRPEHAARGFDRRAVLARTAAADEAISTTSQPTQKAKVSLVSLGCPKNTVDGEVLLGDLARSGFEVTDEHEGSDAIIINTCGFVEDAKAESLAAILEASEMKKAGQTQKVVVTGCLAQRYAEDLAESIPEADIVMGFQSYGNLSTSLRDLLDMDVAPGVDAESQARVQVGEATVPFRPEWDRHRLTPRHTAYLRVAEGCSHSCSFCAIPGFRGRFRSKPWQAVLEEARILVDSGAVELNLIAEDTNQYGMDRKDGLGLAQLMRELAKLPGLQWMRILYAYPSYFTEELIEEIATNPKVCKYIDIPLQHINNLTLLGMNRPPRAHTEQLLRKLRERIPGLILRTTFISGFPGESEESHRDLMQFCEDFRFERMGCFAYSEEEGTPAASMQEQVPPEIRAARRDELISLQQRIGQEFAESMTGREVDVLVDSLSDEGEFLGRTQYDAPDVDPLVFLSSGAGGLPPLQIGQMRRCLVSGASLFDLEAVPIA